MYIEFLGRNIDVSDMVPLEIQALNIVDKTITSKIDTKHWTTKIYKDLDINISFKIIKSYIVSHKESDLTKTIYAWFAINLLNEIRNPDILTALQNPLPEKRLLDVYKYTPFRDSYFITYFYDLYNLDKTEFYGTLYNFIKGCPLFLSRFTEDDGCANIYQEISDLYEKNPYLKKVNTPKKYENIDNEYSKLTNKNVEENDDYKEFYDDFKYNCEREQKDLYWEEQYAPEKYRNELRGKIGELYVHKLITESINCHDVIHVARELGDGFGYDIYFNGGFDGVMGEHLIEVKSTKYDEVDENNNIKITENEMKCINKCMENPTLKYTIARVHINEDPTVEKNNRYKLILFRYNKEQNALVNFDGSIVYSFDKMDGNDFIFKIKQPTKTLSNNVN